MLASDNKERNKPVEQSFCQVNEECHGATIGTFMGHSLKWNRSQISVNNNLEAFYLSSSGFHRNVKQKCLRAELKKSTNMKLKDSLAEAFLTFHCPTYIIRQRKLQPIYQNIEEMG